MPEPTECSICHEIRPVCCGDINESGEHENALCHACCGPHRPFNPQVQGYPQ